MSSGIVVAGTIRDDKFDAAFKSVTKFKGLEDESIELKGYEKMPHGNFLVLSNNYEEFWINEDNFEVERYSSYLDYGKKITLSSDEAYMIAKKYASKKLLNHSIQNTTEFKLVLNELNDGGDIYEYEYQWREYIDEIEGPSLIDICINPDSGAIMSYIGISRNITIPIEYSISSQDAESLAIQQFGSINTKKVTHYLKIGYDEMGSQQLFWIVTVYGKPKNNQIEGGIVLINAQSGEISRVERWL